MILTRSRTPANRSGDERPGSQPPPTRSWTGAPRASPKRPTGSEQEAASSPPLLWGSCRGKQKAGGHALVSSTHTTTEQEPGPPVGPSQGSAPFPFPL